MANTLAYLAAGITGLWGVAHVIPTAQVASGFGPIRSDNRRVIVQEWIAESITMWGIAALVLAVTLSGGDTRAVVYRVAAAMLLGIAGLTALTGARTRVFWFKVCPVLMSISAVLLIVAGSLVS